MPAVMGNIGSVEACFKEAPAKEPNKKWMPLTEDQYDVASIRAKVHHLVYDSPAVIFAKSD